MEILLRALQPALKLPLPLAQWPLQLLLELLPLLQLLLPNPQHLLLQHPMLSQSLSRRTIHPSSNFALSNKLIILQRNRSWILMQRTLLDTRKSRVEQMSEVHRPAC